MTIIISSTSMASTRSNVISLYKQMMRESKKVADYNFRNYFIRRTRDAFREHAAEKDGTKIEALIKMGNENLAMLQRQTLVGNMFGGDMHLVIENEGNKT